MSQADVATLFDRWNNALQSGEPKKVAALYANDAILLPTLSDRVCHNPIEYEEYFAQFMAKGPIGHINESNIRLLGDLAINSGIYTFELQNSKPVQARYTFVYRQMDNDWKIIEHHSSLMPEANA